MYSLINTKSAVKRKLYLGFCAVLLSAACSVPGAPLAPGQAHDPYEAQNRKIHEFNRSLDQRVFRKSDDGAEKGAGGLSPDAQIVISNFADNTALPGVVVNNLLQADVKNVAINTYRFAVNTVLGFGGLFDVASDFGIPKHKTDFGETLHVWGAPEGAYQELPVLGPSTERDTAGKVVDLFTNPLSYILPSPEKYIGPAARVTNKIVSRGRYASTVESVLYDSADSYAQSRTLYLQNRRYEIGDEVEGGDLDPYANPYADPYEDPYVE